MILIANSQDLSRMGGIGGVKTHVALLSSKLNELGRNNVLRSGLGRNEIIAKASVAFRALFSGKALDAYWLEERARLLRALTTKDKFSLIHAHDPISAYAFRLDKRPLVMTVHGPFAEESASVGRNSAYVASAARVEKMAVERADAIITVDEGQKDLLLSKYSVESKVTVISNAVDANALKDVVTATNLSKDLQLLARSEFFVLTRRLVPKNGVAQAVLAFLEWQSQFPSDVKLVVLGDGPERGRIESLVKEHRKRASVLLMGARPNEVVISLLARAKACLVPSIPSCGVVEATSISVLEALALGVPVIGSKLGGIQEIGTGVGGIHFVSPDNRGDLIKAYTAIAQGIPVPEFHHDRFRREYGADGWIDRILRVYDSLRG